MAKGILDEAQVLRLLVKVGAATVPEDMAAEAWMLQVRGFQGLVHDPADAVPGDAPHLVVRGIRKYERSESAVFFDLFFRVDGEDVLAEDFDGRVAWVNGVAAPARAFAAYRHDLAIPVDVFQAGALHLDVAQPLDSHEIDDGRIAKADEVIRRILEDLADFADLLWCIEVYWLIEVAVRRGFDISTGVFLDEAELLRSVKKGIERDDRALDGLWRIVPVDEILVVQADRVVGRGHGMAMLSDAPADEAVDPAAIVVHRVLRRAAFGDVPGQELCVMRQIVIGRDGFGFRKVLEAGRVDGRSWQVRIHGEGLLLSLSMV